MPGSMPQLSRLLGRSMANVSVPSASPSRRIALDSFAFRQFDDPNYGGTRIEYASKQAFEDEVNSYYDERFRLEEEFGDRPALVDGYAPFCKHLFMPNFCRARVGDVPITPENEHLLRTVYEARNDKVRARNSMDQRAETRDLGGDSHFDGKELPVLVRYFPRSLVTAPEAKYLDLIMYSREQMVKEAEARGSTHDEVAPWSLISIKAQSEAFELPMSPITIMRNELLSQGGSGVPIDRNAYLSSFRYWEKHAIIK